MLPVIPSAVGALPPLLRCEQEWHRPPRLGELIAADLRLVDAAGVRQHAAAWHGRPARVYLRVRQQCDYAIRLDADGVVCEVTPLN